MRPHPVRRAVWLAVILTIAGLSVHGQYGPFDDAPMASVSIRVSVPDEVTAGADVTYRITAANVSRGPAHHVQVKAKLPDGVRFVRSTPTSEGEDRVPVWKLGTLEPGQRREVTLVVKPTTDDDIDLSAYVQFEHGQRVKTRISRPGLNIRRTGPTTALLYDAVTYKMEVTNTGRVAAKKVVVEETLPKGLDYSTSKPSTKGENPLVWELGDVLPGQTKRIEYTAFVKETGKLTVRTLMTADGVKQEKSATLEVGNPGVDVTVAGPSVLPVGRQARYTVTVVNTGTAALTNVKLSDELPPEIVFLGAVGGRLDGDHVRWDIGTIAAGGKRTVSVDVRSRVAGKFKNVFTATANRGLVEQGKVRTLFVPIAGLAVVIEGEEKVTAGQETTLVVRLVNLGAERQEKVPLVVTLPDGLELIEARGPGKPESAAGKIRFGVVEVLEAEKEVTATVRVKAVREGEYKIEATAGAVKDVEVMAVRAK
jgi:uncharacterized repeat protein (TIGR01451 family)